MLPSNEVMARAQKLQSTWREFVESTLGEQESQRLAAISMHDDGRTWLSILGERLPVTVSTAFRESGEPVGKVTVWIDTLCKPQQAADEALYIRYYDAEGRFDKNPEDEQSGESMDSGCRTRLIADCVEAFVGSRKV